MQRVYLDNAATTKVDSDIIEKIVNFYSDDYANPSAIYRESRNVRKNIDMARQSVAKLINADEENIFFTSGATESDNWVLMNLMKNSSKKHIITSKIEHPAILSTCEYLEKNGFKVSYIDVNKDGTVSIEEIKNEISKDTALISIMAANNEIGTIEPIEEIAKIANENGIYFHTDAVQAIGKIDIDAKKTNIDFLSMSAHKIHALKGIGAIYVKNPSSISKIFYGGEQENEKRPGTENVAGIVSMGLACEKLLDNHKERQKIKELRDYLIDQIFEKIDGVILNGDREKRICNNANFSFENVDSRLMVVLLDKAGICASVGSACSAGDIKTSHVIEALGISDNYKNGNLRLTLGKYNTKQEIDYTVEKIEEIVKKIRM